MDDIIVRTLFRKINHLLLIYRGLAWEISRILAVT